MGDVDVCTLLIDRSILEIQKKELLCMVLLYIIKMFSS